MTEQQHQQTQELIQAFTNHNANSAVTNANSPPVYNVPPTRNVAGQQQHQQPSVQQHPPPVAQQQTQPVVQQPAALVPPVANGHKAQQVAGQPMLTPPPVAVIMHPNPPPAAPPAFIMPPPAHPSAIIAPYAAPYATVAPLPPGHGFAGILPQQRLPRLARIELYNPSTTSVTLSVTIQQFQIMYQGLTPAQQASYISRCLAGSAVSTYASFPAEIRHDIQQIFAALKRLYEPNIDHSTATEMIASCVQTTNETVLTYFKRLRGIVNIALATGTPEERTKVCELNSKRVSRSQFAPK